MKHDEAEIRNEITKNLNIFQLELELINIEHYVAPGLTTKSFIDILAKDDCGNYVIIEVKRSNQSSRQAIHEILKYTEAIRKEFNLNYSEIKSIIVSTEWKELYIPFSSFVKDSNFTTLGYQIEINNDFKIVSTTQITPCSLSGGRLLSPEQRCDFYLNEENLERGIENHKKTFATKELNDFILVILQDNNENRVKDWANQFFPNLDPDSISKIQEYPFMIYSGFQRLTEQEYINKLGENYNSEFIEYLNEYSNKDKRLSIFEQEIVSNTEPFFYFDEFEIGYPAKFANKILIEEKWEIIKVIRSGRFSKNKLLTDEVIIDELCGYKGSDLGLYENECKLPNLAKIEEITDSASAVLFDNSIWRNDLKFILRERININKSGDFTISIFNPENILLTIIHLAINDYNSAWLPKYIIKIETLELTEFYLGTLHWNGKQTNFRDLLTNFFQGDISLLTDYLFWNLNYNESTNAKILSQLGLTYETYYVQSTDIEENSFLLQRYEFKQTRYVRNGLMDFIASSPEFVSSLVELYNGIHISDSNALYDFLNLKK